nr:hypothetical protein [Tanacetum cinerariifolium]
MHDLDNVICVFQVFFLASGLKINIHKSSIYEIGVSTNDIQIMAANTGCSAGLFPFTYLGGLAIGSLNSFSLTLLHKWRWHFFSSPDSLWVNVIKALHGSEGGFDLNGCKFKDTWSKIVGTSNYLHSSFILPINYIRFQALLIGTREELFGCNRISNRQWSWNWSCSNLGIRNSSHLNNMLAEISHIEIRDEADKCIWSLTHDETFNVGDLCRIIDDRMLPSLDTMMTWDKSLPRKVNIFIWRLKLDRLPHRLNLSYKGIKIPEISCPTCNGNVESNIHNFFECIFAKEIWRIIRRWCDDSFPLFDSNAHWIDWLNSWLVSRDKKHSLFVIIVAS